MGDRMVDREKVIEHIADCVRIADCQINHNWVFVRTEILKDALALLKAQEPRVLSVADIIDVGITPDIIWIERRKEDDVGAGVWQIDHYEMVDGGVVDDLGEEIAEAPEAYNTKWRCWTSRPTDEQMKTVKWDGDA